MNPSRISTPVFKIIDTWHFKFNQVTIRYHVYMERPRDAQTNERNTDPKITFSTAIDHADLGKAGIESTAFSFKRLKNSNINQLRRQCEHQVRELLHLDWKKVIIVGFKIKDTTNDNLFERNREPAVDLTFDFVVAFHAASYYRHTSTDETGYYYSNPDDLLHGFSYDKSCVHVLDYSDSCLESLKILKTKYDLLNQRISELIQPGQIEHLLERLTLLIA